MNLKTYVLYFFTMLFLLPGMQAQEWVHIFEEPTEDFTATFSAISPDGGVVVANTHLEEDSLFLAKFDASGAMVWENKIYRSEVSYSTNPIGCGGIYFNPDGSMDLLNNGTIPSLAPSYSIISIDENGEERSRNAMVGSAHLMRTLRLDNGDFLVTRSPGGGWSQIAPDGTLVWENGPAGAVAVNFTNTIARADNGHLLMFVNGFFGSGINGIILHTNELGELLEVYNMPYQCSTQSIAKGVDGHFMAVGSNDSLFFVKMALDGTVLNEVVLDEMSTLVSRDIVALPDGYLVAGSKDGQATIWRLDINGNVISEQIMLPGFQSLFTSLTVEEGNYTVYGSGSVKPFGTSEADVFVLKLNLFPLNSHGIINGTVRLDPEGDCLPDLSEDGINKMVVAAVSTTDTYYALTDTGGTYTFVLDTGDYLIQPAINYPYLENCGTAQFLTIAGGDIQTADFWEKELYDCPLMLVNLSSSRMRRCNENYYAVNYCNLGTAPAFDSYVEIVLDTNLVLLSSSIPLSSSAGDTLIFALGDLGIGDCGSFSLTVEMDSCLALQLGQSICSSVQIYPDSLCSDPANWNGASMEVGAICEGDSIRMFVTNSGTAPSSTVMDYIITEDNVILMQGGEIFNQLDTTWFAGEANGQTWRATSDQEPNHPGFSSPNIVVEGCGVNGVDPTSLGVLSSLPMDDADFSFDIECNPVIGSHDPNEKEAFPTGVDEEHFIAQNIDIEYTLRFQNTGNDTAFLVVLRDTLPEVLNAASIQMGGSSHSYTWTLEGQGELVIRFENILLVDSTTNEPASNGWVKFRIAQEENLAIGTRIENSVAIYFDFNEPIITNTAFHTVGEDFLEIKIINEVSQVPVGHGELFVYPNPSFGSVIFALPVEAPANAQFILYNQMGRVVERQTFDEKQLLFNRGALSSGVYFYRVEMGDAYFYSGKVILK